MVRANPAGSEWLTREIFQKRLPVAVLVLLLHVAVLSLFTIHHNTTDAQDVRETVITFPVAPKKPVTTNAAKASTPAPRKYFGTFVPPRTETKSDLSALRLALTGCAPENIGRLSSQNQGRCRAMGLASNGTIGPGTGIGGKSQVKDAQKWEAEIIARNTPPRVPCTGTTNVGITGQTAVMVDPICVAVLLYKALK